MRVDLTTEDLGLLRRVLTFTEDNGEDAGREFDLDEFGRMSALRVVTLAEPERLLAELRPAGIGEMTFRCVACDQPITWAGGAWRHEARDLDLAHPAEADPVDDRRIPHCPKCGNTGFSYEEGCTDYRPGEEGGEPDDDGEGGTVSVTWEIGGTGESGDSDPGLFCDHYRFGGCGAPIDLPDGWEIDYR